MVMNPMEAVSYNTKIEKQLFFADRIDEIKGVSSLIKAFHMVLEAHPNSRLLIAGNGDYTRAFQEAKIFDHMHRFLDVPRRSALGDCLGG